MTDTPAHHLRAVFAGLVRAAHLSDDEAEPALDAARAARRTLIAEPGAVERLHVDGSWTLGKQDAEAPEHRDRERRVSLSLPAQSPIPLAEILSPGFDEAEAARRIRALAATG